VRVRKPADANALAVLQVFDDVADEITEYGFHFFFGISCDSASATRPSSLLRD